MDGEWQIGHVPAKNYAIKAQQAAKMMKDVDSSIETILCGSSNSEISTYPQWDYDVLDYVGDLADYISLHKYVGNHNGNISDFLAVTNSIDEQINTIDSVCKTIQAKHRSNKRAYLSFDEWNVWYKEGDLNGRGQFAPHLIEEIYTIEDALVVAGFLNSFIRHADVVKIANIAQLVNVIAPIITKKNKILIQSIYFPFKMIARNGEGVSLRLDINGPGYHSESYGYVNYIDASAILNENKLNLFLICRNISEVSNVEIEIGAKVIKSILKCEIVNADKPGERNSFVNPDIIRSKAYKSLEIDDGKIVITVPPLSFIHLQFEVK